MAAANKQKFLEIADDLAREIGSMRPGDKFPTANELTERYRITISTASKVIKELQSRGLIASKRGTGSIVSSQQQQEFILCILPDDLPQASVHWLLFQTGICFHCGMNYEYYSVIATPVSKIEQEVNSLKNRSQSIAGAVFFRDHAIFLNIVPKLKEMGINSVFYGSSAYRKYLEDYNCCFYNEEEIIMRAMTHLYDNGHRNIGCIYDSTSSLDLFRHDFYLKYLEKKRLTYSPILSLDTNGEHYAWFDNVLQSHEKRRICREYLSNVTALLVLHDYLAVIIMQEISKLGFKIPEDISIVSIDNLQIGEIMRPRLDSIELAIYKNTALCLDLLERTRHSTRTETVITPIYLEKRQSVTNISKCN